MEAVVSDNRGISLVIVIFVTTIALLLGTAILNMSTSEYLMVSYARDYTAACYLAEGGIQKGLSILKENPDYRGETGWQRLGEGQYKIKVSQEPGTNMVTVESTGKINEAEVLISVKAEVHVEVDEESNFDPPQAIVQIHVLSWDYEGPI